MEIEWFQTIKDMSPTVLLIGLLLYCVRAVFTGTWVPGAQHDRELQQAHDERDRWKETAEKWENVAEERLKLIQTQQATVLEVTEHVVKAIRQFGDPDGT